MRRPHRRKISKRSNRSWFHRQPRAATSRGPATSHKECRSAPNARRGKRRRNRYRPRSRPLRPLAQKPCRNPPGSNTFVVPTPLNGNLVTTIGSRLGFTVHEMPASVDIVTQQQMQEQGYRTTTEAAQGAIGVLSGDVGGAPATFSMRGFTGGSVNTLYNGIWIGPGDITSRI